MYITLSWRIRVLVLDRWPLRPSSNWERKVRQNLIQKRSITHGFCDPLVLANREILRIVGKEVDDVLELALDARVLCVEFGIAVEIGVQWGRE
jgi:hypothetical protein